MAEHKNIFPIVKMSEVFDVSRSGYYSWMSRSPSDRARENQRLLGLIKKIWLKSGGRPMAVPAFTSNCCGTEKQPADRE